MSIQKVLRWYYSSCSLILKAHIWKPSRAYSILVKNPGHNEKLLPMFFSDSAAMPLLILEKSLAFYEKMYQSSVQKVDA